MKSWHQATLFLSVIGTVLFANVVLANWMSCGALSTVWLGRLAFLLLLNLGIARGSGIAAVIYSLPFAFLGLCGVLDANYLVGIGSFFLTLVFWKGATEMPAR